MLERAEVEGTLIVINHKAYATVMKKLFTAWFPELTPKTLVTRNNQKNSSISSRQ